MKHHLSEEELTGYALNLLTDADREALDQHLQDCPACHAALEGHARQQARMQAQLQAELAARSPSPRMTFAAIAPAVRRSRRVSRRAGVLEFFRSYGSVIAAAVGVILAAAAVLRNVTWPLLGLQQNASLSLPFAAGIMLGVPAFSHYGQNRLQRPPLPWIWVAAMALWLGTALLGLYEIALLRDVLLRAYLRFGPPSSQLLAQAEALGSWGVFFMGGVWVALVIGGGEYHYHHVGQRASWRLFAWTVLAQLALLTLPLLV
ncbi:MAG TPA: zf-HC2 domain-containing protein [Anaerolineae bacterium]|nr:zf-HC2 domain-containing protein [Anaerolineae bacterium]